jgi:hypothetical protein
MVEKTHAHIWLGCELQSAAADFKLSCKNRSRQRRLHEIHLGYSFARLRAIHTANNLQRCTYRELTFLLPSDTLMKGKLKVRLVSLTIFDRLLRSKRISQKASRARIASFGLFAGETILGVIGYIGKYELSSNDYLVRFKKHLLMD